CCRNMDLTRWRALVRPARPTGQVHIFVTRLPDVVCARTDAATYGRKMDQPRVWSISGGLLSPDTLGVAAGIGPDPLARWRIVRGEGGPGTTSFRPELRLTNPS